jgi:predicted Abi (CAAX) family protease
VTLTRRLRYRLLAAFRARPSDYSWRFAIVLILLYCLVYVPIGFSQGLLSLSWPRDWQTIGITALTAFVMPGLNEEIIFRVLLIPHRTEPMRPLVKRGWIGLSWLLFVAAHFAHPWVPLFFWQPAFVIGAGLMGVVCTLSYLQSRSVWPPIFIHWFLVSNWLLFFGGLAKFNRL